MKERIILKGIAASFGIAKGKARIVLEPSQSDKVKEGDVLVTEMTDPRFLPAMEKAKAIVTDIGGLLSHAAIVSREMRIPCVINTKEATKILKDNQEIIVNGTKGEVYASE